MQHVCRLDLCRTHVTSPLFGREGRFVVSDPLRVSDDRATNVRYRARPLYNLFRRCTYVTCFAVTQDFLFVCFSPRLSPGRFLFPTRGWQHDRILPYPDLIGAFTRMWSRVICRRESLCAHTASEVVVHDSLQLIGSLWDLDILREGSCVGEWWVDVSRTVGDVVGSRAGGTGSVIPSLRFHLFVLFLSRASSPVRLRIA